ncbi:MAG: ABC transporter ATP-binding protein [Candidatus Bathyarchaeota archaeon]|nr:MAG: ABC transporter ATP-binding protein [Candidatus Bathyarchaeota archaeon]
MNSFVRLQGLTKRYNDATALEDVNLEVKRSEVITVIGPNGSGKTTLLRMMAFLDKPTEGEIYFDGGKVDDNNRNHLRTKCTMVFQKTALFDATVYNNIAYGLRMRKRSKGEIKERILEILELVRLEGYEKRQTKKLSGGEQQRVSLARALVLNTELLLLDEPTANLDPRNATIIEEAITRVNREYDTTVVATTHNMFQAEDTTERVALLLNGRIAEIGTASEIFRNASKNLASFARLENVFSGISKTRKDGTSLIEINDNLWIEAASRKEGKATILVRPEDVIVSRKTVNSSARNVLAGKIVGISDMGSTVKLNVDVGKPFVAQITKRSFSEMRLNLNSEVFLTFKASSVYMV